MASRSSDKDGGGEGLKTTDEEYKDASNHSEEDSTNEQSPKSKELEVPPSVPKSKELEVPPSGSSLAAKGKVDKVELSQLKELTTSEKDDKTEKTEHETQLKPDSLGNIFNSAVVLLGISVVVIIAVSISYDPPKSEIKSDITLVKVFGNGVEELQSSFTNQTERFWRILKNRGLAHLRNTDPSQPLVFLLAAPPPAHDVVDCLATKLAEKLDPRHKRNLAMINGTVEKGYPADSTKRKMDDLLKDKFLAGHRVALIHHLELLPPPSPLLFYSYCDDQNAPHKHVAIIFTVNLPAEPSLSLSPQEAEGTVEKYLLNEVWSKHDKDAVAALLSRIADTVVLMNGESNDSLKAFCS